MAETALIVIIVYACLLVVLSGFALHRLALAWSARKLVVNMPASEAPKSVLVQIPLYNERYVARRIIDAVCRLEYPRKHFAVQVLDDSTDGTDRVVAEAVRCWARRGVAIAHVRRTHREGYKAGALAEGLNRSKHELVAIFDADFVPRPDFLHKLVAHFNDPKVGLVQARWGYLNRAGSLLTQAQAMLLDGHFINEHAGRVVSGCFFNFNGTAGIWRRTCIDDAGGWSGRTLTEDLDLSYRAQLKGWKFVYRPDVVVPSELPMDIESFKGQQRRWAKGSLETARHLLVSLWKAPGLGLRQRLEATLHLLNNLAYVMVIALSLLMPWAMAARGDTNVWWVHLLDAALLFGSTGSLVLFYAIGARGADLSWRSLWFIPVTLAVGAGLAINNTRAVWQAVVGKRSAFNRTPKLAGRAPHQVDSGYWVNADWQAWCEFGLGVYLLSSVVIAGWSGRWMSIPFLALLAGGFLMMGSGSIRKRTAEAPAESLTPSAIAKGA